MKTETVKSFFRGCIPPLILSALKKLKKNGTRYEGKYASWEEARSKSTGYDAALILEKVSDAISRVKSGKAAFERDSVTFETMEYPLPILAILLRAAAANDGVLHVLDFGGSLGSLYFQCREFLSELKEVRWHVVEQSGFVARGRSLFETDELKFMHTVGECMDSMKPDVVLLGSVLQYLPDPYARLDELAATGARFMVMDKTPMAEIAEDRICIQTVSPEIYPASYPCRIFSEEKLKGYLDGNYALIAEYSGREANQWAGISFKSLIYEIKGKVQMLVVGFGDCVDWESISNSLWPS